jgi:hypothetical protein
MMFFPPYHDLSIQTLYFVMIKHIKACRPLFIGHSQLSGYVLLNKKPNDLLNIYNFTKWKNTLSEY